MKPEHEGEYFKKILMDFFNQTGGSEEMEKAKEHDGCMDCAHVDLASDDYPCSECSYNYTDKYQKREEAKELTRSQVRESPTVDAEPVVRCRDCRWWEDMYGNGVKGYCHACKHGYHSPTWEIGIRRTTDPDFYCGDGERTEE